MRSRSSAIPVLLAVIALVLLPAISNVEANALPGSWAPYLWVAWPAGLVLAAPLVFIDVRQRQHGRQLAPGHGADAADERRRLDRAAIDLATAVRRQWADEVRLRSVRRTEPLRVRWSSTPRPVAADLAEVVMQNSVPGRPRVIRGHSAQQMANVLGAIQDRQLVILGEAGAGKSMLALLLVLHLLEHRGPEEPVPVLLTVSSWNPDAEHLHTWMARRMVEEYPALGNRQAYGVDAAKKLVIEGRVMAVLDGLDEMAASAIPTAVDVIDHAATAKFPLVLTCRSAQYEAAVAMSGSFLSRAAVLEIEPVALADAERFLTAGAPGAASRWRPVLEKLRARPDAPLVRALASPLMISLARSVYAAPASAPDELVDEARFPGQREIERHLLDAFIPAAYRDNPAARPGRYPSQQVRVWLRFLAQHLGEVGTGGLAWWQLAAALPRATLALCMALPAGLLFGVAGAIVGGPVNALAYVLVFATAVALAVVFGRLQKPTRVQLRFHGMAKPFLGRFAAGFTAGLGLALALRQPADAALGSGFVFGLAFAPWVWLEVPADATELSSPRMGVRQNRVAALAFGLSLAVPFGFVAGLGVTASSGLEVGGPNGLVRLLIGTLGGALAGGFAGRVGYGWAGAATFGLAGSATGALAFAFGPDQGPVHSGLVGPAYGIAFGFAVGVTGTLSRAWGTFAAARAWLALRGHQPWRLMRFLEDAHRRGVLRQSGAVYEFRHAKLQEHLTHPAASGTGQPPAA